MLGRDDIGELAVGKQADLCLFNLDAPRFSGAHDALAALVLCGAHSAERVMVGGQWTVAEGRLINQDINEIQARHQQQANRLVS